MNKFISRFSNRDYKAKFAVVCAHDIEVLETVSLARELNIADFILVGDKKDIINISKDHNFNIDGLEIVDEKDMYLCSKKAVSLIRSNDCNALMKGLLDTSIIMKAVLDKENGLRTERRLSHVAFFILNDDREYFMTDGAINIAPDLDTKKHIIENAVIAALACGYDKPNVACLCAKEHVDVKMPATVDAARLQEACLRGDIKNCNISGPLALDNAVSIKAAEHKGIKDPVAGRGNILLVPNIESGNIFYKTLLHMTDKCEGGAVVVGASVPIALGSRSDDARTKVNDIILTSHVAIYQRNNR